MSDRDNILEIARRVLLHEREAIDDVIHRIDINFLEAVDFILDCKGKVIVTGLGKSGIAGKKIAATFASTGTPALFMHAAEAVHGDMGVMSTGDVAVMLSYSGETAELIELLPKFKLLGVPVISLTGKPDSSLGKSSDCVLDASVKSYPWPFGVIPTASNVTAVALGDALAIAVLVSKGIVEEDFALLHPGGLLGRKLLVKIGDLMHTGDNLPVVDVQAELKTILVEMTGKRLGVACVTAEDGRLLGIITDGDLRRLLERDENPLSRVAEEFMTRNPRSIDADILSAKALHLMEEIKITSLPVTNENDKLIGLIHMHDIIKLETGK